ncbi:MAG: ATPase, partial [Alphaproteobacteria bacterium]|nr:ATPase [Alphaproteobacteria bacterium]
MTHPLQITLGLILALAFSSGADAKVTSTAPTGFSVEHKLELKTDAKSAYDAFTKVGSWWNSAHSFSGDAKNLKIDTRPGGCWCETLPEGGFVKHMDVVHAAPGAMLVFSGGLGPLHFMGVAGS